MTIYHILENMKTKQGNHQKKITPEQRRKIDFFPIVLMICLVVLALFHTIVFSNFSKLLQIPETGDFLSALKIRSYKISGLIIIAIISIVLTFKVFSKKIIQFILSTILWVFIFFYLGELYCSTFPLSQGNGEAYVAKIWFKKYWKLNKFDFRDRDFNFTDVQDKKTILYIGDSYVAGHGIKNTADRSPDILEKLFNGKYFVINGGRSGAGTLTESYIIRSFPIQPSYIVFNHVPNDIEDRIPSDNHITSLYKNEDTPFAKSLFKHSRNSVLGDMIYYFFKGISFAKIQKQYAKTHPESKKNMYNWYQEDSVFKQHLSDLQEITHYVTDSMNAKLIFVTYPDNYDFDSSDLYINKKIAQSIKPHKNLYFLNTTDIFKTKNIKTKVNFLDGHPSIEINKLVADSLFAKIKDIEQNAN